MTILQYNFATVNQEDGVQTVGFADDQFNPQQYLLFQRWMDAESEAEDDEIYIERNDQSRGIYGGVEKLVLLRDHALVMLSADTAEATNTEPEIKVLFSITDEEYQRLKAGFKVIFGVLLLTP